MSIEGVMRSVLVLALAAGAFAGENPIDRYLAVKAEPVSDALFARRAYLDAWGLLPTPEQLRAFTAHPDRARLVDELLANRRNYAEHWITFWNDLLRNDEGVIYHGARESITDWLYGALEHNLPYDRMVTALLEPKTKIDPNGFLVGVNWRGTVSASQIPAMQAAQNSAQVFLGVNLKCNSCHDSFISNWKLADAYGLAGYFSKEPLDMFRCDVPTGRKAETKFLYPGDPSQGIAKLFLNADHGRAARTMVNRIWDRLFGFGLVRNVDDMDQKSWNPELLEWLAADFAAHGYDLQYLLRTIMTSRAYSLPAVAIRDPREALPFRGPILRRLTAEEFVDAVSSITGEWRVLEPKRSGAGTYSRDWRLKSTPLTRVMGRPIRDQVFTTRNQESTTLQALETTNGETLATLIERGAARLEGRLKTPPHNLFDSGIVNSNAVDIEIDVSGASRLWLLVRDADSYDPTRSVAAWVNPSIPLGDLKPVQIKGREPAPARVMPLNSELVVETHGASRFRATVGVDVSSLKSDISPRIRFFVFTEKPDMHQLVAVAGEPPVPRPASFSIARLYEHALGRKPSAGEARFAKQFVLEDLLWALFLSPEFQFVR